MTRHLVRTLAGLAAGFALAGTALAAYPDRPVTLVHGFGAGGNADSVARVVAAELEKKLGQPFIVESRTGAGGTIASAQVAKAPADGYTLIMLTGGHTASAAMRESLPYDPVNDFAMISTVTQFPFVIAVSGKSSIQNLKQLVDQAKAKPGSVTFSSVGVGSTQHLTGELLSSAADADMLHIPYRGGGAPVMAVMGGEVDVLVDTATVAGPHIESGGLRALAVTSAKTWPPLPDVPVAASVLPDFEVMSWLGLAAPAGTPADVVQTVNAALREILADPAVVETLARMGSQTAYVQPQEMHDRIDRDIKVWRGVVTEAGIPLQ